MALQARFRIPLHSFGPARNIVRIMAARARQGAAAFRVALRLPHPVRLTHELKLLLAPQPFCMIEIHLILAHRLPRPVRKNCAPCPQDRGGQPQRRRFQMALQADFFFPLSRQPRRIHNSRAHRRQSRLAASRRHMRTPRPVTTLAINPFGNLPWESRGPIPIVRTGLYLRISGVAKQAPRIHAPAESCMVGPVITRAHRPSAQRIPGHRHQQQSPARRFLQPRPRMVARSEPVTRFPLQRTRPARPSRENRPPFTDAHREFLLRHRMPIAPFGKLNSRPHPPKRTRHPCLCVARRNLAVALPTNVRLQVPGIGARIPKRLLGEHAQRQQHP